MTTEEPALISHLISRDICAQRQDENFHKCPNCTRSRLWKETHPEEEEAGDSAPDAPAERASA